MKCERQARRKSSEPLTVSLPRSAHQRGADQGEETMESRANGNAEALKLLVTQEGVGQAGPQWGAEAAEEGRRARHEPNLMGREVCVS